MKQFELSPAEVNTKACAFTISPRNKVANQRFIILGTFGALMSPHGDMFFRTRESFASISGHEIESPEDIERYYMGIYRMPDTKLTFQKKVKGNPNEGKATLQESMTNEVYLALWALPKVCLRMGSPLMNSEGSAVPFEMYHEGNEYVLRANTIKKVEAVKNTNRPNPDWFTGDLNSFYLFTAGERFMEYGTRLLPSADYANKIIGAYKEAQNAGYAIPDSYIEYIQSIALV